MPSKVLLDEPYPENLIVCSSCLSCNNALSIDETYLACLLECVLAGEADPAKMHRPKIAKVLANNPSLLKRLREARSDGDGRSVWAVENERVKAVVLKLARGHAAHEYNEPRLEEPDCMSFKPIVSMDEAERQAFEGSDETGLAAWPEVGNRAMQRLCSYWAPTCIAKSWLVIQEGNYRFHVSQEDGLTVNIVLREYLGCHIVWE